MEVPVQRRYFLGMLGAIVTAGCLDSATAEFDDSSDPSDPLEQGGVELAYVEPVRMQSYDGVSATVYNDTSEQKTVTVQFTVYHGKDILHEGTDVVSVPPREQAPVSQYWERVEDQTSSGWDAKIISVE